MGILIPITAYTIELIAILIVKGLMQMKIQSKKERPMSHLYVGVTHLGLNIYLNED